MLSLLLSFSSILSSYVVEIMVYHPLGICDYQQCKEHVSQDEIPTRTVLWVISKKGQ